MREKILNILNEINPTIDYEKEEKLIDDEILESFDILSLVTELMDAFNIDIDVDDLEPENLNSVDAICELVRTRMGK